MSIPSSASSAPNRTGAGQSERGSPRRSFRARASARLRIAGGAGLSNSWTTAPSSALCPACTDVALVGRARERREPPLDPAVVEKVGELLAHVNPFGRPKNAAPKLVTRLRLTGLLPRSPAPRGFSMRGVLLAPRQRSGQVEPLERLVEIGGERDRARAAHVDPVRGVPRGVRRGIVVPVEHGHQRPPLLLRRVD